MNYQDRIQEIKEKDKNECWGSMLYVAGALSYVRSVDLLCAQILFEKLEKISEPIIPCLVGIYAPTPKNQLLKREFYLHHLAIVTELNPMKITYRREFWGPLVENELFNSKSVLQNGGRIEYRTFVKE